MIEILTKVYERPLLLESGVEEHDRSLQRAPGDSQYSKSKARNQEFKNEHEYL